MEKRAFQRVPVSLQSRLFYGNMVYTGIVTDISENGLFISTKMSFPVDSVLIAEVLLDHHYVEVPIQVRRTAKPDSDFKGFEQSGMGVRLLNHSQEYVDFITKVKTAQ
jgi:hypothetical protein